MYVLLYLAIRDLKCKGIVMTHVMKINDVGKTLNSSLYTQYNALI